MALTSTKPYTVIAMRHGGTHLIQPIVRLLTHKPLFRPKGEDSLRCTPNGPTIIFVRNPRNVLVSQFRWKFDSWPSDQEMAGFLSRVKHGTESTPVDFMWAWAQRWMNYRNAMLVRFEALADERHGISEVERMRDFLQVEGDATAIYRAVYKKTTYTGRHSDWRGVFGPVSIAAYYARNGRELDDMTVYENRSK